MELNSGMTIKELLRRHPAAARFFLERNMLCAGCPTEAFHTLQDVARIHRQALPELIATLWACIASAGTPGSNPHNGGSNP